MQRVIILFDFTIGILDEYIAAAVKNFFSFHFVSRQGQV